MEDSEFLAARRYVSLIVRLLLDANGELVAADIRRLANRPGRRVHRWDETPAALQKEAEAALRDDDPPQS